MDRQDYVIEVSHVSKASKITSLKDVHFYVKVAKFMVL